MKIILSVILLTALLLVSGCRAEDYNQTDAEIKAPEPVFTALEIQQGSSGDAVFIRITQNGIGADASEVVINNYYPGATAEMVYRIHNATVAAIQPEIYFADYADIADYSKADGAIKAPPEMPEWLKIPKLKEIKPGEIEDYTITVEIPKNVKNLPDKFGFQVQVAGNTGGMIQTAVGTWWIVKMR